MMVGKNLPFSITAENVLNLDKKGKSSVIMPIMSGCGKTYKEEILGKKYENNF